MSCWIPWVHEVGIEMRILIITEEDELYLPLSIDLLLAEWATDVVEVVCARNPLVPGRWAAARRFVKAFGVIPLFKHALRLAKIVVLDTCPPLNRTGRLFSIRRVCLKYGVPYVKCHDVNDPQFLQHCLGLSVDLIVSVSPTQIFKEQILCLPRHGCINIHSSKLPKYRGLYPVYWAMACGEHDVGVSVHYIEKGIDTGKVILQDTIEIPEASTLDQMLTVAKIKGAHLLIDAVRRIQNGTVQGDYAEGQGSYYSFPTAESYRQFKSYGYRLW